MSAELRRQPGARSSRIRAARILVAGTIGAGLWFAVALGADDVTPPPGVESPAPSPTADGGSLLEPAVPTPDVGHASAPPLPTPIGHPDAEGANGCYDCHDAVNEEQAAIAAEWKDSAHDQGGVACADCHGGDPRSDEIGVAMDPENGFVGAPGRLESVGLCGSCHADVDRMKASGLPTDQYAKYWSSVHGQRLATGDDARVAVCTDCHGSHDVKKVSDPSARVFALNVPELCSSCHADAKRMEPYGIPTDQLDVYSQSVHGKALLENNDVRAPSCASCHGSHDAQPPTSANVVDVCGKCHTATQDLYAESRHSELDTAAPKCWTCHGTHDVSQPGSHMFFHPEEPDYTCNTCHDIATRELRLELNRFASEADRRCDTCHHTNSQIYAQIEGIAEAVTGAEVAYKLADDRIAEAARLGMITADAEVGLAGAKTSLIQAQAAVHTTKLSQIAELSDEARSQAAAAEAMALAQVDESVFRRQAMVVVLALIAMCILFLAILKRRYDRDLERQ